MKYEIEIPDGVIPEGYEPVAFRRPCNGNKMLSSDGELIESNGLLREPRLILLRKWQWPEWLDADSLQWESYWVAHKGELRWGVYWEMIAGDPPPDKTRVYLNPRKAGGK